MSYAVMPLSDYKAACDKVREKVDLTAVRFEDTDFGYIRSAVFTAKESGEYIFTVEVKDESKLNIYSIYYAVPEWEDNSSPGMFNVIDGKTLSAYFTKGETVRIFISDYNGLKASDIVFATLSHNGEVVENFVEPPKIKSGELADKVEEVYNKGQLDVISKVESLKGKVRGLSPLTILDISPVEHNVGVKITTKPAFDGLLVGCTFEDTDFGYIRSTPFTVPETGYYTIALNLKDDSKWVDWVVAWSGWRADDSPPYSGSGNPSYDEWLHLDSGDTYSLFIGAYAGLTALDILSGTIEMGNDVVAPPIVGGDVDLATVKVTASGKNLVDMKNPDVFPTGGRFEIIDDNTVRNYGCAGFGNAELSYRVYAPTGTKITISYEYELGGVATGTWFIVQPLDWMFKSGSTITVPEQGYLNFGFIRSGGGANDFNGWVDIKNLQVEIGTTATEYEPYTETKYTANADGIVEGVKSIYPKMVITTDAEGVVISADYIKDIDKAFNELTTAVALSGGE